MMDDGFMKTVTDALTALGTLQAAPPECQRQAKSNFSGLVTSVITTLREMDPLWTKYMDAGDSDTCGMVHARLTAKFRMIDERVQKFTAMFRKAIDESQALRENLDYLVKRVAMAQAEFPKTPRKIEDPQMDLFEDAPEEVQEAPEEAAAEPVHDAQWNEEELFTRRLNEFRTAVATFVNSYDPKFWNTGVVGFISCVGKNAKHVEEMWRRYLMSNIDMQIADNYRSIGLYIKSIKSYIDMADGVCRYLEADGKYRSSLDYVERKYGDFKEAYPATRRTRPSEFGRRYAGTGKSLDEILSMCARKAGENKK